VIRRVWPGRRSSASCTAEWECDVSAGKFAPDYLGTRAERMELTSNHPARLGRHTSIGRRVKLVRVDKP
jgi:hypothetical protein